MHFTVDSQQYFRIPSSHLSDKITTGELPSSPQEKTADKDQETDQVLLQEHLLRTTEFLFSYR